MSNLEPFLPISLPSNCRQYLVNPGEILVRPYIGRDEVYLSEVSPANPDYKYINILKDAVKGIDPGELTLGDRQYIMIWEYIQSYGGFIRESAICSHCLSEVSFKVDLRELDVISIPDDMTFPHDVTLPVSGKVVKLRLLTVNDEIAACNFESSEKNGLIFRCARTMVDDTNILERIEFLSNLQAMDLAKIRAFHEKFDHGPDMRVKFKCQECGEEDQTSIPFRLDIIFPRGNTLTEFIGEGI